MGQIEMLVILGVAMVSVIGIITILSHIYNLDNIKLKTVGDGQHGTARWAKKNEIKKTYKHIPYTPELWRKGKNLPKPDAQGIVVGCDFTNGGATAIVDSQDVHALMIGAAGVGKTAFFYTRIWNMPVHRECRSSHPIQKATFTDTTARSPKNTTGTMFR